MNRPKTHITHPKSSLAFFDCSLSLSNSSSSIQSSSISSSSSSSAFFGGALFAGSNSFWGRVGDREGPLPLSDLRGRPLPFFDSGEGGGGGPGCCWPCDCPCPSDWPGKDNSAGVEDLCRLCDDI